MFFFGHLTLRMYLRHLVIKTCSTLMDDDVSLQVSDPKRRTDFTFTVLNVLILVFNRSTWLLHTGLNISKACCDFLHILCSSSSDPNLFHPPLIDLHAFDLLWVFFTDICKDANPCQNGGSCNSYQGGYICECKSGYTGKNCETGNVSLHSCFNRTSLFRFFIVINVISFLFFFYSETMSDSAFNKGNMYIGKSFHPLKLPLKSVTIPLTLLTDKVQATKINL